MTTEIEETGYAEHEAEATLEARVIDVASDTRPWMLSA
jgi:hypothetical protein